MCIGGVVRGGGVILHGQFIQAFNKISMIELDCLEHVARFVLARPYISMMARRCLGSPRDHPQALSVPHHTLAIQVSCSALPGSLCQTKHLYLSRLRAAAAMVCAQTLRT